MNFNLTNNGSNFELGTSADEPYVPTEGDMPLIRPDSLDPREYVIQSVQARFWGTETSLAPAATEAPWESQVSEELEAGTIEIGFHVVATGGGDTHEFDIGPFQETIETNA